MGNWARSICTGRRRGWIQSCRVVSGCVCEPYNDSYLTGVPAESAMGCPEFCGSGPTRAHRWSAALKRLASAVRFRPFHVFNHLQTLKTAVSFHFVPIPGASNFAHGAKLRLTTLRRAMFSGPAFCFSTSHMLDRDPFAPFGGGRRLSTAFSFLIRKQGFLCLLIPAAARGRRRHATPPARPATGQASRRGRLARPG